MSGARSDARVYLVGFMAAGKSAVGRCLARDLGWQFADSDELVIERDGRPIEQIFAESGEARFRELEWEALRSLDPRRPAVVACGGGVLLSARARRWLAGHGVTVWIDVPLETVRARLDATAPGTVARPLWPGDDPLAARALFERRRAVYALATLRVDGSAGAPLDVARRVRERLERISGLIPPPSC